MVGDYSGSILIFAGVAFSVVSLFVSLAGSAKINIEREIMNGPNILVYEESPMLEKIYKLEEMYKIYYVVNYAAKKPGWFFGISFLYLLGALADLLFILFEGNNPSLVYYFSLLLIILATFLSLRIIGNITCGLIILGMKLRFNKKRKQDHS